MEKILKNSGIVVVDCQNENLITYDGESESEKKGTLARHCANQWQCAEAKNCPVSILTRGRHHLIQHDAEDFVI